MKIVYINNLYPPHDRGGAEQVVRRWALEALKKGDQPVVITWGPWQGWGSSRPVRTIEEGIMVYRFWVPQIFSYINLSKHFFLLKLLWHILDIFNDDSARIIRRILQKEKPDIVQTHNLMGMGFFIPRMVQQLDIKHTHVLHDVQLVEPSGVLRWNHTKDSWSQKKYTQVMKWMCGEPQKIIVMSDFLQRFYQERHFFPTAQWEVAPKKEIENVIQKKSRTNFLFVGSLGKHKGILVLMDAWDRLSAGSQKTLDIVGSGRMLEEIQAWAKDNPRITVHGRKSQHELEQIYKKCDVLLFPSICLENRPTVIVEALQYGLYVVAANTGGVRELVDSRSGELVEPGNPGLLAQKIQSLH